jgi:hypothetical protein
MEPITWFLIICGIWLFVCTYKDTRAFFIVLYRRISDFLYDFRADMEGVKSIEELENESESD